jgi:RimJ/RimL family protein N-acetyltransferase
MGLQWPRFDWRNLQRKAITGSRNSFRGSALVPGVGPIRIWLSGHSRPDALRWHATGGRAHDRGGVAGRERPGADVANPEPGGDGSCRLEASLSLGRKGTALTTAESVRHRPVQPGDLPRIYDLQLDPESNRMAVTIPRTREAFDSHWAKLLDDPGITSRAVLVDGASVGYISCFPMDGQDHVGYWIDRAYWGLGIASRALHLLLREVADRPLVATAATSNGASVRVLQKCGFVVERVRLSPASDRYPECEEAVLVLR